MPRTSSYGQLWAGRASSSSSDDEQNVYTDYEDDSSELSELSESEYTPDTEPDDSDSEVLDHYVFKLRQRVLVRPRKSREWYEGVVLKIREPTTREEKRRGRLYIIVFRRYRTKFRDCFSPLEGNIKPDTPRMRAFLFGGLS